MKSKRFSLILVSIFVLSQIMAVPLFASNESDSYASQQLLHEKLDQYYEIYGDYDAAAEALQENYSQFHLIGSWETPATTRSVNTSRDSLLLSERLWYSDDGGYYYYYVTWEWVNTPDINSNNDLWDLMLVVTDDPDELALGDYIITAMSDDGSEYARYTSKPYHCDDGLAKSARASGQFYDGFSVDESVLTKGTLSVSLEWTDWNSQAEVHFEYHHAWTTRQLNGVGFDVSSSGGGVSISWDNEVNNWSKITDGRKISEVNQ